MRARALLVAGVVAATACSTSTSVEGVDTGQAVIPDSPHPAADDVSYLFEFLAGRIYQGDRIRTAGRLTDYLPNTRGRYVDGSEEQEELHPDAAIIIGEIVEVVPDRAVIEQPERGPDERDEDRQQRVPFDDPEADWRSWIVTIHVEETFGDAPDGETITSGVTTWGDLAAAARFANGLRNIGPALFVITRDDARFFPDYDDVWLIGVGGILIAPLGEGGALSWPMLRCTEQTTMLEGASTLDELRARAAEPVRHVEIEHYGESWRPVSERPVEPPPETGPPGPPIAVGDRPEC